MAIDHLGIRVSPESHKQVVNFYLAALKPLGYTQLRKYGPNGEVAGLGANKPDLWITASRDAPTKQILHLAFTTTDRKVVDAFYSAAIEAGGKDNGAPGPRPQYHENYYGAFVTDPVGINLEVVSHTPPSTRGSHYGDVSVI